MLPTWLIILLAVSVYLGIGACVFLKETLGADNPGPIKWLIGAPWFIVRSFFKD